MGELTKSVGLVKFVEGRVVLGAVKGSGELSEPSDPSGINVYQKHPWSSFN